MSKRCPRLENIEIRETDRYGKALFTKKELRKDEVVFTICGPVTTEWTLHTIPISWELLIDDQVVGMYLNHSCEPNCGIRNRTQVVAMHDISEGEELTIDYAMIVYEYGAEMTKENRKCACGASNCRGKLGCYKDLPDELKTKCKGYISEYLTHR